MSEENLQSCNKNENEGEVSVGTSIFKCVVDIIFFLIACCFLFLLSAKSQSSTLINTFIVISAIWLILSYCDIMLDKIFKYKNILFFSCLLVCFSFSSLMWYVSNESYNYGYEKHKQFSYYMLVDYVKNILNSDDSFLQQKKNLKLLFSQFNAEVKIYERKNKENVIYEQNFKIDNNIINYSLNDDFGCSIDVKKDTKEHKVYSIKFTSYKEQKSKKDLYFDSLTFGLLNETDSVSVCVPPSIKFILFHYINITSFWLPFFVLWCIFLFGISFFVKNDKEENCKKRFHRNLHRFLTMIDLEVENNKNKKCKSKSQKNKELEQQDSKEKNEDNVENKEDKNI